MLAQYTDQIQMAAALVAAIGVLAVALWKVYKIAHRVDQAIGVDSQGRSLAQRMERVEHQLWPNGGTSLKDQTTRMERATIELSTEVRLVRELLQHLIDKG